MKEKWAGGMQSSQGRGWSRRRIKINEVVERCAAGLEGGYEAGTSSKLAHVKEVPIEAMGD